SVCDPPVLHSFPTRRSSDLFFVITGLGVIALGVAIISLRKAARAKPVQLSLSGFSRGYGKVFANPRAKVCFGAVFVEGIVIFGRSEEHTSELQSQSNLVCRL